MSRVKTNSGDKCVNGAIKVLRDRQAEEYISRDAAATPCPDLSPSLLSGWKRKGLASGLGDSAKPRRVLPLKIFKFVLAFRNAISTVCSPIF